MAYRRMNPESLDSKYVVPLVTFDQIMQARRRMTKILVSQAPKLQNDKALKEALLIARISKKLLGIDMEVMMIFPILLQRGGPRGRVWEGAAVGLEKTWAGRAI
jgi:hypothetical protein